MAENERLQKHLVQLEQAMILIVAESLNLSASSTSWIAHTGTKLRMIVQNIMGDEFVSNVGQAWLAEIARKGTNEVIPNFNSNALPSLDKLKKDMADWDNETLVISLLNASSQENDWFRIGDTSKWEDWGKAVHIMTEEILRRMNADYSKIYEDNI